MWETKPKFKDSEIRSQPQLWPLGHRDNMDSSKIPGKNILQDPVVGKQISANPWINFNPGPKLFEGLLAIIQTRLTPFFV